MKSISNITGEPQLKRLVKGLALVLLLLTAFAASAHADNTWNRGRHQRVDRDWNNHEWQARRYWSHPRYEPQPHYVYAPPLVYAPPVYEEPGINFIIPLHIH